jgi:two-component system, response regulator FlrC
VLAECGGSRIETAKRLGISERTLRYRLAKAREQGESIDFGKARASA